MSVQMSKIEFTPEQENAIKARGRVLVSAAAGSGKTAVLVERAVKHMTEKPIVDADRLLIVTFTNAAAAEMKSRIASKLKERTLELGLPELLKRQQYLLSIAKICTIDSFCISLVRENFYRLGISPDFKIADESVLSMLKTEAINSTSEHFFTVGGEDFNALCDIIDEEHAEENFKKTVLSIYKESCNHPFPMKYIDELAKMYKDFDGKTSAWIKSILDSIKLDFDYAQSIFEKCLKYVKIDADMSEKYSNVLNDYGAIIKESQQCIENSDWDKLRMMLLGFSPKNFPKYKGEQREIADMVRGYASEIRKIIENAIKSMPKSISEIKADCEMLEPVVNKLVEAVKYFMSEFSKLKKENNCVDFIDVEYMALVLLCDEDGNPSDIAKNLSSHYFEVMVDEFQDVNDLQNTIFNLLSNSGKKMFMVGDVKQSIYRFRNANPRIFLKNRNELPLYAERKRASKVIMSGNFRSAPEICQFVNKVFSKLMTEQTSGMNYGKEDKLQPLGEFSDDVEERVVYDWLNITDVKKSMSKAEIEANELVRLVSEQLEKPAFIQDDKELRQAKYGDIAILLRNSSFIPEIKKAFDKAGIPCSCKAGGDLLDYHEIMLLLAILETINNPFRDINTASVMMSPIFGFTADELTNLRLDSKYSSLYSSASKKDSEKCVNFCERIRRWREWSHIMNTGDLIRRICDDCSFFNIALTFVSGERSRSNILAFISIADSFDKGADADLIRFLRYIKRASQSSKAFGVSSDQSGQNAVQVITIHASKGLQYPVCILAGLSTKINRMDAMSGVQLDSELGFGMNICNSEKQIKYKNIPQLSIKLKQYRSQISEELCILYVAMTRAKDRLIMLSTVDDKTKYADMISNADLQYKIVHANSFTDLMLDIYPIINDVSESNFASLPVEIEKSEIKIPDISDEQMQKMTEILEYKYPYDSVNTVSSKVTASGLSHSTMQNKYKFKARPMFTKTDKVSAANRGTACHKFMECCDFKKAKIDINAEINRLLELGIFNLQDAKIIDIEKIKPFFKSKLYTEIISNADKVLKEQRFIAYFDASEIYTEKSESFTDEKVVVQGAADLLVIKGNHLCVVDYKTDNVSDMGELVSRYHDQLKVYQKAFERIFGCETSEAIIYSLCLGDSINVK